MQRPQSIIWFERLYLGCCAISFVGAIITMVKLPQLLATALAQQQAKAPPAGTDPQAFQHGIDLGMKIAVYAAYGSIILSLAISALIWFFIARKRNEVFKWIEVLLFGLATVSYIWVVVILIRGPVPPTADPFSQALGFVAYLLQAGAVYFLFRPDARAWFKGEPSDFGDVFR